MDAICVRPLDKNASGTTLRDEGNESDRTGVEFVMRTRQYKGKRSLLGAVVPLVVALAIYFLQGNKEPARGGGSTEPPPPPVQETEVAAPAMPAPTPPVAAETGAVQTQRPAARQTVSAPSQVKESRTRSHWHRSNLQRHWEKHGAEFPECASAEAYGQAAQALADNPPEGTLRKTTADGDQMFYHPPTNRFLVMTADGTIKTCFKPEQGINYWRRQ